MSLDRILNTQGFNTIDVVYTLLNCYNQQIDNLRLQKLIYFCHGYYIAITKKPLINEHFEAWQYGPVVSYLYNIIKIHGGNFRDIIKSKNFKKQYKPKLIRDKDATDIIEQVILLL